MRMFQGNLKPEFEAELVDEDGGPLDFADALAVRVVMRLDGVVVIDRVNTEPDDGVLASAGVVRMTWRPGDTNVVGDLYVEVVVEWPDGEQTIALDEPVSVVAENAAPPLVNYEQLRDHMSGRTFSPEQERAARQGLRSLTRSLERKLKRRFVVAESTEWTFANEEGYALLDRSPCKDLLAVNGSLPEDVASFRAYGVFLTRGGIMGLRPGEWHRVRYTGGGGMTADDLEDVRLGILDKAAQIMTTRHDDAVTVRELNIEERTTKAPDSWAWTKTELEQFDELRRRIVL